MPIPLGTLVACLGGPATFRLAPGVGRGDMGAVHLDPRAGSADVGAGSCAVGDALDLALPHGWPPVSVARWELASRVYLAPDRFGTGLGTCRARFWVEHGRCAGRLDPAGSVAVRPGSLRHAK